MRIATLVVLLTVVALPGRADDLLGPADYLRIVTESKLRYNITSTPSKSPWKPMECPRRDASARVVKDGNDTKLVPWMVKPEAVKLLNEGEQLYQAKKFDEAGEKYKAALALDPEAVIGDLSYGDTLLFGRDDDAGALAQYRKGIALDPTLAIGHFFAQTALVRLGRRDEAREELVEAISLHPGYLDTIEGTDPARWNMRPMLRHRFDPPDGMNGGDEKKGIDVYAGKDAAWLGYAICKAARASEKQFAGSHVTDGWSVAEERACVVNQLMGAYNRAEAQLEDARKTSGTNRPIAQEDVIEALPTLEHHLYLVAKAGLLDGYILVEIMGRHCPIALSTLDAATIEKAREYLRKYLIVAVNARS